MQMRFSFKEEKLKKHLSAIDYYNRFGAECQHLVKMSLKLENTRLKSELCTSCTTLSKLCHLSETPSPQLADEDNGANFLAPKVRRMFAKYLCQCLALGKCLTLSSSSG